MIRKESLLLFFCTNHASYDIIALRPLLTLLPRPRGREDRAIRFIIDNVSLVTKQTRDE